MSDRDTTLLRLVAALQSALQNDDRALLKDTIAQLVALRAAMGDQWRQIAQLAAGIGELSLFRSALDLLVDALGGDQAAHCEKAALLAQMGEWQQAYDLLCTLPEDLPDPIGNAYARGAALVNLGRPGEAREPLERAVSMRPELGTPWLVLAMSADLAHAPELADRIVAAEADIAKDMPGQYAPYCYALGNVHAARGEPAPAFAAYSRGARLMRAALGYDSDADRREAAETVRDYTAERIRSVAERQHEATGRTIFVTGLPRSGTTLVQQIITAHSAVSDGAETNRLMLLAKEVGGQSYPAVAHYLEANAPATAAHLWQHWMDEMFPGADRVVDKTVTTSRYLGLAATLLPQAPLVWLTRDPLDRAWSCFRMSFLGGAMPWSYDLEDIALHFRLEDQLLAQWQQILGERLLTVPYERLISDPATEIRRILAHCGLPEEPQVFAPHENRLRVSTASMMQVRQPINRGAIGSAEPYREFLGPFIDAYYA